MEKKRRLFSGLIAALVVITLVSCCFVGVTFARYTSSYNGSATVGVAKWDVEFKNNEDAAFTEGTTITVSNLSPLKSDYNGGGSYVADSARKLSTDYILVAKITNSSEVNALVTLTSAADTNFFYNESNKAIFAADGNVDTANNIGVPTSYTKANLADIFKIELFTTKTEGLSQTAYTNAVSLAKNETIYVYAKVTWTSDTDATYFGTKADQRDTWIGENIAHIKYDLTLTAVQDSELNS